MWTSRMKSLVLCGLLGCLLVGLAGCPCLTGPIIIRDPALESAIRATLGKPFGCLSLGDLQKVTEIQAANLNIHTLDGLENCPNLTILNVMNNDIQSVTPLSNLGNLAYLDVGFNRITNIQPLAGLFFLDHLYIDGNEIFDLSPLVANVVNGGLGDGDLVVLPDSILDGEEIQDIFLDDVETLLNAGISVFVEQRPDAQ